MIRLVVATRSDHKLREIIEMTGDIPGLEIVDLEKAGVPRSPAEDSIEAYDTFEENAVAKARYYAERSGGIVLADDSGLSVDALAGAPGVRSKRFSGRTDIDGVDLDLANNALLLRQLAGVPDAERTARYVCALALVSPAREELFRGTVEGRILCSPRGEGGFGYDPLFYLPALSATFAEIPSEAKNQHSHRGDAIRAALPSLRLLGKEGLARARQVDSGAADL